MFEKNQISLLRYDKFDFGKKHPGIPYLEKQGCFKGGVPGCLLWEKEKRFTPPSPTHPNRFHPTGADDSGSGACSFGPEMRGGRCADCYSRTERQPV